MQTKKLFKIILFTRLGLTACITLSPGALQADTVAYALGGGDFGTVDLNTGMFRHNLVFKSNHGLGVCDGNLYGTLVFDNVYRIDPSNGDVTALPVQPAIGGPVGFGSTTGGLFMIGATGLASDGLYSIDHHSAHTLIGLTGLLARGGTGSLSVSNGSNALYWAVENGSASSFYSINTSTGAATLIGNTNGLGSTPVGALLLDGGTLWGEFVNNKIIGPA